MRGPLSFRPRERRLALIAGVFISCWAVVSWLGQPLWDHLRDLRFHVETQTEKVEAFSHLLAQAPAVEREYAGVAAYLDTADDEGAQGAFLNELETLSRGSQIQLNLKPRPVKRGEWLSRFEVELDVEGQQQHLMAFLDALLRMPKLLAVDRLRISTIPTKPDVLRANLVIEKLSLQ